MKRTFLIKHCLRRRDARNIDLSAKAHHGQKIGICVNTQYALLKTLRKKCNKH